MEDFVVTQDFVTPPLTLDWFYDPTQTPALQWQPHNHDSNQDGRDDNDCLADFMGSNTYNGWRRSDGYSLVGFYWPGDYTWKPPTYPYNNPITTSGIIEAIYGLSQYIAVYAGYHCITSYAQNNDPFNDTAHYHTRAVLHYRNDNFGAVPQDIADEIDAGRPLIVHAVELDSNNQEKVPTNRHAFAVFGYKWEDEGQRLQMLAYDTRYEDAQEDGRTYRTVPFPNATEAPYNSGVVSFCRKSYDPDQQWKVFAFTFLKINDNARCPLPLGTNDYPSAAYADEFDIDFDLPAGNSRVHYEANTPTPASPYVTLDANGEGTLHIEGDSALYYRTYRDATLPNGYLASDVVRHVFSVFGPNKNIKKLADNAEVTTVNGIVTHVVDDDYFYLEERDKRLFGIQVHKAFVTACRSGMRSNPLSAL